ncbi:MAG: DUF29 family protein [Nostoc sp.]|uniref:DUF29 family protein n=1 Tax=Nostoc sp. TaxID=1180 RepID=UPI002FF98636
MSQRVAGVPPVVATGEPEGLATITLQRREILKLLKENPRLKPDLEEALQEFYENARDLASGETNLPLSIFPKQCLYACF